MVSSVLDEGVPRHFFQAGSALPGCCDQRERLSPVSCGFQTIFTLTQDRMPAIEAAFAKIASQTVTDREESDVAV
jgi:hypothetical protein